MPGFTINTVTLSGNHTRDPEARTTPGGLDLCKCRIAFNERRKDQSGEWVDKPNFVNVTIFGGLGSWVASNQGKGDSIIVSGRLSWHEWTTDDGNKREAIEVIADSIGVPRSRSGGGDDLSRYDSDMPVDTGDLPEPGAATAAASGGDDDIPF